LLLAAAWVAVIWLATTMGSMPGTMGLGLGAFVGVWALMMAAMMLPAVAPVAAAYSRSFKERRRERLIVFASGYLLVWASSGLVAFAAALLLDRLTGISTTTARVIAAVALLGVAVYQLTPLKRMCLEHCRSPLSQLLHYAHNFAANIGEVYAVRAATILLTHSRGHERIRAEDYVRVATLAPADVEGPVSCGIPGHDHPGTELVTGDFHVDDLALRWEVTGRCGFATQFAYSSDD
jgi:hypothetical protein